jgi:MoaA/NifB/PqqE/SkfB family radical SAM enzyme
MNILDIKKIELEITSNCNAACPGCTRTQRPDILEINSFTITDLIKIFPKREFISGKIFKFCGVLGDPIINPDCFAMVKYLVDNGGWCQLSTNAGLQTAEWWAELGKLSAETNLVDVSFCVDGHKETNHIYRINTKFETIERNMQAYSTGGRGRASASWIYIIFDHNEHELEIAKEHALKMGFKFSVRTGMRNSYSNWVSVVKKRNQETRKLEEDVQVITTTGTKEHAAKDEVLKIDEVINKFNRVVLNKPEVKKEPAQFPIIKKKEPEVVKPIVEKPAPKIIPIVVETPEQRDAMEELKQLSKTITCKYLHEGEMFIASNFTLWPCCFLWDSWFANKDDIRTKLAKYDSDWNNLRKYSIDEILNHPWYAEVLQLSWDPTHNQHINRCVRTCALNKAYQNKIEVVAQPEKEPEVIQNTSLSCNHLSNHLAIVSSNGIVSPCCQFEDYRKSKEYKTIWNTKSLNGVLKSEHWRELRANLANDNKISNCNSCWRVEEVGGESRRKWINKITETTYPVKFEDIEIGLDYTCNMMCRICKPSQSSKWNTSTVARDLYARRPAIYKKETNGKEYQDRIKEVLEDSYLGHIKRVRLVGGEPFYSKNFEWFMNKLADETSLENLTFAVNTNGSLIPKDYILERMFNMQSVSIDFSIDAVGELASTTRWGILWDVIEKNINRWIELSKEHTNIKLSVHSTISILNINRIQELIDFCDARDLPFGFSVLRSPDYLDFRQLPVDVRTAWTVNSNKQEPYCIADINKSITSSVAVPNKLHDFIYFNERMDNYQERTFSKVNAEIINLIEKYKNE